MIDHMIFTVRDLGRSKAFYEKALAPLGMTATPEFPWGPKQADPSRIRLSDDSGLSIIVR